LAGLGVVLVGVIIAGTLVERSLAASSPGQPGAAGWAPTDAPADGAPPAGAPGGTAPAGGAPAGGAPVSAAPGGAAADAGPGSSGTAGPVKSARYVFPVDGKVTYERTHHDYPATDIIAACGAPVRAVTDGVVLEVSRTDGYDARADDGAKRGGLFVSVLGDDGVRYYGSHLRVLSAGIDAQARVRAGDALGEVGDTGDAGVCHLHFGLSPQCARVADWWVRRGTIWPWSYLDVWRRGDPVSPAAEIIAWNKANGCPGAPG